MGDITEKALERLGRLSKQAAAAPWAVTGETGDGKRIFVESDMEADNWKCCRCEVDSDDCDSRMAQANARLIAAARNALPALIAEVRRARAAREVIDRYGSIDGAHHKQWVLDQAMRKLTTPEAYAAWVAAVVADGYEWDEGIAP